MQRIINNYLYGLSNPSKISYLTFYVNNICQLRCSMCFYWDSMQKKTIQLSLDQIKKIAKSLPNLLQLSMTGGEPTLRKDLPEVVKTFCDISKVAKCSIITNGMMTERIIVMVKKILSENVDTSFRLCVSIDGIKEVHNKIRGVEKSYENAIKTFFALKELKNEFNNLHVDINTTVSKFNFSTFFEFAELVRTELNPDHHTATLVRGITKEDDANDIPIEMVSKIYTHIKNSDKKHEKLEHKLIKNLRHTMYTEIERIFIKKEFKYYCTAGKKFMVIYQDGKAAPCEILHTIHPDQSATFGNLNEFDFDCQKLLNNHEAQEKIKWIKDNKCFCTFECAKSNDVAFNPKLAVKTLARLLV